ncbi:MAG: HyaD/HybD family hydrogenase maturation endopeptidase [bacterium]
MMGNQDTSYTKDEYSPPTYKPKILIIGLGNTLLQDEGIGVHIIQKLQTMDIPDNIELVDGGTAGLDLMEYMNKGIDKVIIIDAVKGGRIPGTTFRLSAKEIMTTTKHIYSMHQAEVAEAIKIIDSFGRKPKEIVIIGVVPKETEWSLTLSPELQNKIPYIIRVIFDEIEEK